MPAQPNRTPISVAPMMDWTDRHCRYFHRLIAPDVVLYSEMVTTAAIIHGERERLLGFSEAEKPLVLQLGGNEPNALARCAEVGQQWGYNEINLNCGCPSERVRSGSFGACLMAEPALVADCVAAMQSAVDIPVTVKSRIGIDLFDSYDFLRRFVDTIAAKGCRHFIIHARKAILGGLTPKENREVPPLVYDYAYRIKQEFPELQITINGGIKTVAEVRTHLEQVDGVMIGRAAYENPWLLRELQNEIIAKPVAGSIQEVVQAMAQYADEQLHRGVHLSAITRHMLGLFPGRRGARRWRQILTTESCKPSATSTLLLQALQAVAAD